MTNISYPIFDERGSATGALTVPYIQHIDASASAAEVSAQPEEGGRERSRAAIGGKNSAKRQRRIAHRCE